MKTVFCQRLDLRQQASLPAQTHVRVVNSRDMENTEQETGSHMPEPVRTPENPLEYEWLTVEQAVAFCAERGLTRTPKTLRKWAERSYKRDDADIIVRREDTMWAYRWKIEKSSLARKIDEELSLAQANQSEPVRTGAHMFSDSADDKNSVLQNEPGANHSTPVQTGSDMFARSKTDETKTSKDEPGADMFEPVRTRLHVQTSDAVHEEMRKRLDDKDAEIAFLRGQLEKAQAEVGRRANSTDEALKTIDRVVHSFEMQAEANRALALQSAGDAAVVREATEPIQFTPQSVSNDDRHSAQEDTDTPYQQERPSWHRV